MKYILVSQGIKIYETYDKQEALYLLNKTNEEFYEYKSECEEQGVKITDNKVFMYEEE